MALEVSGLAGEDRQDAADLARIADPFARIFMLNHLKTYLLGALIVVVLLQGYWLYRLGMSASAHVYEVHPDGKASYIADREANLQPRPYEAVHVAKSFVSLVYAWNSSTIDQDIAAAVTMCNDAMAGQLRQEFADAQFVSYIRESQVRSEIAFKKAQVVEQTRSFARVQIEAAVSRFGLVQYEGAPREVREVAVEVILSVVPREPELRPNGLEVARLVQTQKLRVPGKKDGGL